MDWFRRHFYRIRLTMHMSSGAVLVSKVSKINIQHSQETGKLTSMKWEGRMPFYFNMEEVVAIELKTIWRWQ